ncbi:hypothetical protein Taro_037962 [Colocasia esculenta]|uniref:Uncharacterized protein n=1 Tax=Colocasia esculenta TaxID=4460 RepID=A0A843WBD1_COLES|nr:hypothetical protein [Colocasia esculenta]
MGAIRRVLFGSLWIMCVMVVMAIVRPMWFGCVVCAGSVDVYCDGSLNGIKVDANLCDLQNISLPEDSFLSSFSLSLALFSCPLLPHYFQQL